MLFKWLRQFFCHFYVYLLVFVIFYGTYKIPGSLTEETHKEHCNFKVNLDLNLRNNGFHRNLSYVLTFVNDYDEVLTGDKPEHCLIGLEQTLPAGLYFRPDEIGSQLSIAKSPVNVEDSAEEAKELTIRLFAPINDWTVNFYMLLHARYHAANTKGGKKRNVIEPPKIYSNCKDDRLFCYRYIDKSVTNNFCKQGANCTWTELPIAVEPTKLTWDVPVGNTQDYYIVAAGTTLSVVAGSMYLLRTIHEYMLKIVRIERKKKDN